MSRPSYRGFSLVLALFVLGCNSEPSQGRVLVLGLDGLDPDAVGLLVSEGKLPHLARLAREGASGRLASLEPMLSPMLWTTVATGRLPEDHGIGHFVALSGPDGEPAPVTSDLRRVEALWTIASRAGRRPAVVGWWATFPPEPVDGWIVSDRVAYHFLFPEGLAGAGAAATGPARTWPPELLAEIAPRLVRPQDVGTAELAGYADVPAAELALPFRFEDELAHLRWAIATATGYRDVGLDLWRERRPDLELVYIEGTDSISHLFGHLFRAEGLVGELAEQQRRYGGAVERVYALADAIVGDYLAELGDDGTLVVLSDHGFALGTLHDDPHRAHEMRRVSERFHRPHGVLYLAGRGVRPGARIEGAELVDVAPTVLALLGLPAGDDMPGRALTEALTIEPSPRIASWEGAGEAPGAPRGAGDAASDEALLAHLKSLGYLGGGSPAVPPTSPPASAPGSAPRSPVGERVLAARLFEAGRHAEAEAAYRRLLAESPAETTLAISLAGTLGAQRRYDEAAAILERAVAAAPLHPAVHHNLGALAERRGRPREAVAHYREAVRFDPGYAPSREALQRLTGLSGERPAGDAAHRQAERQGEEAAEAARHGDYPRALALLDAALAQAPDSARLHHYRANVLFLAGDPAGAAAALERALAMEPGNVLYRENLRRLHAGG